MDIDITFLDSTIDAKLDRNSANLPHYYLKTSFVDGFSGYNIWSNGYCEQWGRSNSLGYTKKETITLLKTYKDLNFALTGASPYEESAGDKGCSWALLIDTTPDHIIFYSGFEQRASFVFWKTAGFLPEGTY